MKNFIPLLFVAIIAIACQKNNSVIISGKFSNPTEESCRLKINYFERFDTIIVNSDGTFLKKIDLDEGHLGGFYCQDIVFPLYLEPGGNIYLELDAKELKNISVTGINISGEKSESTEFLNSVDFKWKSINWQEISKMSPDSLIQLAKNFQREMLVGLEDLKKNNSASQKFVEIAKLRYDVMLVSGINYYTMMSQQNANAELSDFLTGLTDNIPIDDKEKCKEIEEYKHYLIPHYQEVIDVKMKESGLYKETSAYINKLADEISALDAPQAIKDEIADWEFGVFYKRPDSLRTVYRARYKDVVKNKEYIKEFEKIADARDRLNPGNVAPAFNYPDINGNMVSLESFKGKVVYVDVWTTWCGPCKYEFPFQKKLETELRGQDIVFINISVDDDKDKQIWEQMVEEKELGGYHLFAGGDWNEKKIVQDYVIVGVPCYIIIDKGGKLVEVNASRPSNPETKEKLLNLAKS